MKKFIFLVALVISGAANSGNLADEAAQQSATQLRNQQRSDQIESLVNQIPSKAHIIECKDSDRFVVYNFIDGYLWDGKFGRAVMNGSNAMRYSKNGNEIKWTSYGSQYEYNLSTRILYSKHRDSAFHTNGVVLKNECSVLQQGTLR